MLIVNPIEMSELVLIAATMTFSSLSSMIWEVRGTYSENDSPASMNIEVNRVECHHKRVEHRRQLTPEFAGHPFRRAFQSSLLRHLQACEPILSTQMKHKQGEHTLFKVLSRARHHRFGFSHGDL